MTNEQDQKAERVFTKKCRMSKYNTMLWLQDIHDYMQQNELTEFVYGKLPEHLKWWSCYRMAIRNEYIKKHRNLRNDHYTFTISKTGYNQLKKFHKRCISLNS